jgi:hypothetical protein
MTYDVGKQLLLEGELLCSSRAAESLCHDEENAVALVGTREGVKMGGIWFHGEVYGLWSKTYCMRVDWCRILVGILFGG